MRWRTPQHASVLVRWRTPGQARRRMQVMYRRVFDSSLHSSCRRITLRSVASMRNSTATADGAGARSATQIARDAQGTGGGGRDGQIVTITSDSLSHTQCALMVMLQFKLSQVGLKRLLHSISLLIATMQSCSWRIAYPITSEAK